MGFKEPKPVSLFKNSLTPESNDAEDVHAARRGGKMFLIGFRDSGGRRDKAISRDRCLRCNCRHLTFCFCILKSTGYQVSIFLLFLTDFFTAIRMHCFESLFFF